MVLPGLVVVVVPVVLLVMRSLLALRDLRVAATAAASAGDIEEAEGMQTGAEGLWVREDAEGLLSLLSDVLLIAMALSAAWRIDAIARAAA